MITKIKDVDDDPMINATNTKIHWIVGTGYAYILFFTYEEKKNAN